MPLEQRLKAVEEAYDKKMALTATVHYWDAKAMAHGKWSAVYAIASLICGGIGFGYLYGQGKMLLHVGHAAPLTLVPTGNQALPAQTGIPLGEVAVFLILATGIVWLVRLLVRLLLSEMHLRNSAIERVVMIKAYLSMIRDPGQTFTAEEKAQILAVLFRPSVSGLIKEDAMPHPLIAAITNPK